MKNLSTFLGQANVSCIDSHTQFDWIIEYTYEGQREKKRFYFAKNYKIENPFFEELIKRHLINEIKKNDPFDKEFHFESVLVKTQKILDHIRIYRNGEKARPRDDLYIQLNVKLFTHEFVLFDFIFMGYKYILRDIQMPMELYNEFVFRSRPIITFTKDFKVFIAHASEDKKVAKKIANDLTKNGYQVWFDEWEIKVGDSIVDKINKGIKDTAYMIVLFSKNSVDKPWVKKEMNAGLIKELERKKVYILPAKLDQCEIPPLFSDKHYADFIISYKKGIKEIYNAL